MLKDEYKKQRNRLKRIIREGEKKGYKFDENALPKIPKRITKSSVERLKKIKPDNLYNKSVYGGNLSYGEIISGKEARRKEKENSNLKRYQSRLKNRVEKDLKNLENVSRETTFYEHQNDIRINTDDSFFDRVVISNYKNHISAFNSYAYELLDKWLEKIIRDNGIHDAAVMLEEGARDGLVVNHKIVYSIQELHNYISEMLNYLPEAGTMYKDEILDAFDMDTWDDSI